MARPRILVTRSPHQTSALADALRALGAEPVFVPTIELAEPTSFVALDDAILRLEEFHWLLFTSVNAVEVFAKRCGRRVIGAQKIAAIGLATARALEFVGLRVDLLPAQAVAESLTEALLSYARQEDGSSTRFLLVRAEIAREYLPETLREAGAEVTIAPAYRTVIPGDSIPALVELFESRERWPDAITFTSSSTATNLLALLEVAGVELPTAVLRVSIGPVTSQTLRAAGFPPHAEATTSTIPELANAVMQALASRKVGK
jgi:uroporphyrinogen-III synthase